MSGTRSRPLAVLLVLVLAAGFGLGVYNLLGHLRNTGTLAGKATDPTQLQALVDLPGTMVVAQGGNLYSLHGGHFTKIAGGSWTQPAVTPDHQHLIAVHRERDFSDLYELSTAGAVQRQLTNDASTQVDLNHWSFYPYVSPDGTTVYYSYDRKYFQGSFLVDLSIYRMPLAGSQRQAVAWSTPNQGTGGDLRPIPLASGGLLYAKSDIDNATNQVISRIWYQRGQRTVGAGLSPDGQRCQMPSLSPDGTRVAMVCSAENSSVAQLEVAALDLGQLTLGTPTVLETGLPSAPSWSPDGRGLVYYAPQSGQTGPFQLFYVQIPTKGAPAPKAVTANADFDSSAPPVWW
ncbi:MAG: PD40 domain-containing protein [Candidatus Dormibacteraeota bacterium]|nr:PD40 domain-containing protein [Candidatus Dormibacteraeota bacterium]